MQSDKGQSAIQHRTPRVHNPHCEIQVPRPPPPLNICIIVRLPQKQGKAKSTHSVLHVQTSEFHNHE